MFNRGIVVGLAATLVLSLGLNIYLYVAVQRSPEVIYFEKPTPNIIEPVVAAPVIVYVSGAVVRPNVYTLPAGSRVHNVLDAAGGALQGADLARINLARVLNDGEQVHIALQGDDSTPVAAAIGTAVSIPAQRVNINTASQKELETLPGIGPAKAGDIILYRTQNGSFKRVEDIINVKGIGEKTFESIKDMIRVN